MVSNYAMQDMQREILNQVANGSISAEEGAARLQALESGVQPQVQAPPPPPVPPARAVRVVSQFGVTEVIGDPTIAFAVADGPHQARQEGDTMVIEHEPIEDPGSFFFGEGRRRRQRRLAVRMNPDLALLASVQAGTVRVEGLHGPITAEVQAGNCNVSGFRGPLNLSVQAGNVSASGRLDAGSSRIRCEMGAVKIGVEKSSSVRIAARTTMGKLSIYAGREHTSATSGTREVTIGSGAATLDIECTMGNVSVFTE